MENRFVQIACTMGIIILLVLSGCVAPPKGTPPSSSSGTNTGAAAIPTTAPPTEMSVVCTTETVHYVTMETPYGGEPTPASVTVQTILPVTTIPDEYIQIYRNTQYFAYNKTAFSFDLKNPPMLIDFSVQPLNVTGSNVISSRAGGHGDQTVNYDYYSPSSWYQITVRNKASGEILLQDGFQNGYSQNPGPRTIKILKQGNFLIELSGNQITATTNISVKRAANIENSTIV